MYFSARTEGIRTFRHALRAAYRTAISAAHILVYINLKILRKSDTDNIDSCMPVYNKNVTVTVNLNNTDTFIIHDHTHVDRRGRRRFLDVWRRNKKAKSASSSSESAILSIFFYFVVQLFMRVCHVTRPTKVGQQSVGQLLLVVCHRLKTAQCSHV